ncbi:MAG: alkaline phosphatase [Endozoicomonas sp.]
MLKKSLHNAIAGAVMLSASGLGIAEGVTVLPERQTGSTWFEEGKDEVAGKPAQLGGKAKNIILFVGDGMGLSTMTAGRIRDGELKGVDGEKNYLSWEQWPSTALVKTYNTDAQVPDSAGTMTAMVTGVKTRIGMLSVGSESERGDCEASLKYPLVSALTLAERKGMATGVVSTARITHATPAASYAQSPERGWEASAEGDCKDIASQLVEYTEGNGIEVVLGGGGRNFLPKNTQDPFGSRRDDERNLIEEWQAAAADDEKRVFVRNTADMKSALPANTDKLFGLFNKSHMSYEHDRPETEPSLTEMTTKAIEILEESDNGYFLTVESGRIDHAHHDANPFRALDETVEFSNAIRAAAEQVDLSETLIMVTADHSHVMTIAGYPAKGNPILGTVDKDFNNKPYTTLGYINGGGYLKDGERVAGRADLEDVDTTLPDFRSETLVQLSSETHSGEDISLHAIGPGSGLFNGLIEQSYLFHVMNDVADLGAADYPTEQTQN